VSLTDWQRTHTISLYLHFLWTVRHGLRKMSYKEHLDGLVMEERMTLRRPWTALPIVLVIVVMLTKGGLANDNDTAAKSPVNRARFLLLDSGVIEDTENAILAVGTVQKDRRNPLFKEDKPWEPRFDNLYANVIYDEQEKLYKCWYSPFIVDRSAKGMTAEERASKPYESPDGREMGGCYAVSEDGIRWRKPKLGIVEFDGSKKNNIVLRGPHGAGIFKDPREPDPAKRYKVLFKRDEGDNRTSIAFSADGLHWSQPIRLQTDARGDTHCNAFWAPALGKYVAFARLKRDGLRLVARIESPDFVQWTKAQVVLEGFREDLQTYSMPAFPYAGVYIGLPAIFNRKTDRAHTELAWSPDSVKWHRICPGTALIPNSEEKGAYDWGTVLDQQKQESAEGEPITIAATDAAMRWKERFSLDTFKGNEIHLQFELRNSKLYSFSFRDWHRTMV